MTQEPLLLVGAGGHATACIDVIEAHGGCAVTGLIAAAAEVGRKVLGYEVLGTDAELPGLLAETRNVLIVVGQVKTAEPRVRLFETLRRLGFRFPSIVSPSAHVSRHAVLGEGTIVMHGAIVNAGAKVGANCIVNSNALIEHDAVVADHCHISTAAILNGGVRVGSCSFVGSGSVVREGVSIGEHCVVGMGQSVLADCAARSWLPTRATS
jgi:sugar O-acyltransferase (sialic acid O-acetyltransferase NeuD family)